MAEDLFRFGQRMFRQVPGGLAVATIFACAAFGAVSGSSVATVASIGRVAIQEMRSSATGSRWRPAVSVSGTLNVMIPPSIALVLYGIVTGESIGELLIAAIVPGVITAAAYILVVIVRALLRPAAFRPARWPRRRGLLPPSPGGGGAAGGRGGGDLVPVRVGATAAPSPGRPGPARRPPGHGRRPRPAPHRCRRSVHQPRRDRDPRGNRDGRYLHGLATVVGPPASARW